MSASPQTAGSTWIQTDPLTFGHALAGGDRVFEKISDVPDITIPFPGVWEVAYNARPIIEPSTAAPVYVITALYKNGVRIAGSEAVTGIAGPNQVFQATAGQTILHKFAAGDVLTLHAARLEQRGKATLASNDDGRTGIALHWVDPGF
ncbi:hypothetical protein [Actinomadura roseirufa]|uniref:hypothetical protein n=1 Tax=Actinomadura roseirufa TaxID=2094049 RepID=UPI001040FB5F|nr:hypothetical protein [Actinomadura roseirufa]